MALLPHASSRSVISAKHSQPSKPILAPNLSAMRCMRRLRAWQVRCNCSMPRSRAVRKVSAISAVPMPRPCHALLHRQCDLGLCGMRLMPPAGRNSRNSAAPRICSPTKKPDDHARGDAGMGAVRRQKGADTAGPLGRPSCSAAVPLEVVELPGRQPTNASRGLPIACSLRAAQRRVPRRTRSSLFSSLCADVRLCSDGSGNAVAFGRIEAGRRQRPYAGA